MAIEVQTDAEKSVEQGAESEEQGAKSVEQRA
jgi:hypothetical protein